jgi:glycosyltransferase involved in cell wall biosynthesis
MPEELLNIVDAFPNYHYLGEIRYDKTGMAEIVHAADLVCIPGNVGLAIVEAFFWGKPMVTIKSMRGLNSPEIWYLKEGENGYICKDEREMEEKILGLLADPEKYRKFSGKARETALTEAHISQMFKGFSEVVQFLTPSR